MNLVDIATYVNACYALVLIQAHTMKTSLADRHVNTVTLGYATSGDVISVMTRLNMEEIVRRIPLWRIYSGRS